LVIARRCPMPVTATSFAFGARRRNVILPSGETSGDRGGAGPRPGWAHSAPAANKHKRIFMVVTLSQGVVSAATVTDAKKVRILSLVFTGINNLDVKTRKDPFFFGVVQ
jgi:hypothetical protein